MPFAVYATNVPRAQPSAPLQTDHGLAFVDAGSSPPTASCPAGTCHPATGRPLSCCRRVVDQDPGAEPCRCPGRARLWRAALRRPRARPQRPPPWTSAGTATSTSPLHSSYLESRPEVGPARPRCRRHVDGRRAGSRSCRHRHADPCSRQRRKSPAAASPTRAGSPATGAAGSNAASTQRSTAQPTCSPTPRHQSACAARWSPQPLRALTAHRRRSGGQRREDADQWIQTGSPVTVELWIVPDSGHTAALPPSQKNGGPRSSASSTTRSSGDARRNERPGPRFRRPYSRPPCERTHAAVVVLLGDRAYKVKKPVDLGFLDFRSRSAREHACRHEVDLNRRLAPDVYLGVLDIVGEDGRRCEHAMVMRRMPEDRRLIRLVERGEDVVSPSARLAHAIGSLPRAARTTSATIGVQGTVQAVRARWDRPRRRAAWSTGRWMPRRSIWWRSLRCGSWRARALFA